MNAARKLDPDPRVQAAALRAALLSLPLSDEPLTEDEREAFEEGERFLASGRPGHTTEEILGRIASARHDDSE